jgi:hypothetical protein
MSTPTPSTYPSPPGWLASIPGYRGYHDREQRRQADRALRQELHDRLGAGIQALQRLSAALAAARRYDQLGPVDTLTRRLQHLGDRLLAVPEGYRGLFDRERIDEATLDQVLAFDAALAGGVERVVTLVSSLSERSSGSVLDDPAGVELRELAERLHQRLDARSRLFSEGQILAPAEALAVLSDPPRPAPPPPAMAVGAAVSYGGVDYVVDARVSYAGERAWTEYRLRDVSVERWLVVLPDGIGLLAPIDAAAVALDSAGGAEVAGRRYTPHAHGEATASVSGPAGERRGVPVVFHDLRGEADRWLAVREWGSERRAYEGEPVDPALLQIFAKT